MLMWYRLAKKEIDKIITFKVGLFLYNKQIYIYIYITDAKNEITSV